MIYSVVICYPVYQKILIEGPAQFPIREEFTKLRKMFDERVGDQPNILCFGDHQEWIANRIEALREFQKQYGSTGELEEIFIQILVDRHGFTRHEHTEVLLP